MTAIKRYHEFKNGVEENEHGMFVKHDDLAVLQEQLSSYSMSPGQADQRKAESDAVRVALGFSADADDVSPSDLVDAIAALQEQVRALASENVALKSGIGFFSYGNDSGYEEHATADDAIKAADYDIDYYRGDACDGWSDETDQVVWGVVIQRANMVGLRTETDDSGREKEICDYALLPPVETPATDAALREIRAQVLDDMADDCEADWLDTYIDELRSSAARIRAGEQP